MEIQQLIDLAFQNECDKGFNEVAEQVIRRSESDPELSDALASAFAAQKIALITSELSEMLEGVRKPGPDAHCPEFTSEEIEWADAMIRLATYAGWRGLRATEALQAKMAFNTTRPHKHGKAF